MPNQIVLKVIFTRGIPGSGKDYWAKAFCEKNKDWVRINRDDIRHMRGQYWYPKDEDLITAMHKQCLKEALLYGKNVIISDTNLNPQHVNDLMSFVLSIADQANIEVEISFKDFLHVPLNTCIERDNKRANGVGETVIKNFYARYIEPKRTPIQQDPSLPHAIIVDLDGTLALFGDNPYDRDFSKDKLNTPVAKIVKSYLSSCSPADANLVIFSGRSERFYYETLDWLAKYDIHPDLFKMRTVKEESDRVKDSAVKLNMFNEHVRDKYYVDFVLDDRDQVVRLWRDLGLVCLQVADGNF